MAAIKHHLRTVMESYAGEALNGHLYLLINEQETVFSILSIATIKGKTVTDTGIVTRIEGDQIIIERDISNKPLVDALTQAGIPREKIILAYAGEKVQGT